MDVAVQDAAPLESASYCKALARPSSMLQLRVLCSPQFKAEHRMIGPTIYKEE